MGSLSAKIQHNTTMQYYSVSVCLLDLIATVYATEETVGHQQKVGAEEKTINKRSGGYGLGGVGLGLGGLGLGGGLGYGGLGLGGLGLGLGGGLGYGGLGLGGVGLGLGGVG